MREQDKAAAAAARALFLLSQRPTLCFCFIFFWKSSLGSFLSLL